MTLEEKIEASRKRLAARGGGAAPEAVRGSPKDLEAKIEASRAKLRGDAPQAVPDPGTPYRWGDFGRDAAAAGQGIVLGAGDIVGKVTGWLPGTPGFQPPLSQRDAERVAAEARGLPAPQYEGEVLPGHSDNPLDTTAGQYGYRVGEALPLAAGSTAALRAAPELTRGAPIVRGLYNAARGAAQTGTAAQAIGREAVPAATGAIGAEAARRASGGSTLAEIGGGLVGGVAPAVAATAGSAVFVNPLRRALASSVGDVGGSVQARSMAKARELVNVGGEAGNRDLLRQMDIARNITGGEDVLLPGMVSGEIGGGPHLSRTRALAAQGGGEGNYWGRVKEASRKAQGFVSQYMERTAPKGDLAVIQKSAQDKVDALLEEPRRRLGNARASMEESLARVPKNSEESALIVDAYKGKLREAHDAFKARATELYAEVEKHGGLEIPSGQITRRVAPIIDNLTEAERRALGLLTAEGETVPGRLSPAVAQVQAWAQRGEGPVALREVEGLKRVINARLREPGTDGVERYVLADLRRGIDDALTEATEQGAMGAPEAVQAFRQADAFYREGQKVFADGGVTEQFLKGKKLADGLLAKRLRTREGQQSWVDEVKNLRRIGQNETADALEAYMDEYLIYDASLNAKWLEKLEKGQDPELLPKRFERWASDKATILDARPELKRRIMDTQKRRELLNRASLDLVFEEGAAKRHIAGQILGEELDKVIPKVLSPKGGRSVDEAIKELRATVGLDKDAVNGVRRGIWDELTRREREILLEEASDLESMSSIIRMGKGAIDSMEDPAMQKLLRAFFSEEEINNIRQTMGASVLAGQRIVGSMAREGSRDYDIDFGISTGLGNTILRSGEGVHPIKYVTDKVLTNAVNWMRGIDPKLVRAAMEDFYADPRLARALLEGDTVLLNNWKAMKVNQMDRLKERLARVPVAAASAGVSEAPERDEPTN